MTDPQSAFATDPATATYDPSMGDSASEIGFEEIYLRAGSDLHSVPWAGLTVQPALEAWLSTTPEGRGQRALVIGCGLGDDAEALSRHGYRVSAFDIAPTAIAACRRRFPESEVDYQVADLFELPATWQQFFGLVVEIRTIQSLPVSERVRVVAAIAATVRPGGLLWVRCQARLESEPAVSRPWPVSRSELDTITTMGLKEIEFYEEPSTAERGRAFTAIYQRGTADGEAVFR